MGETTLRVKKIEHGWFGYRVYGVGGMLRGSEG